MFISRADLDRVGPKHVGAMFSMTYVLKTALESMKSVMASDSITSARSCSEALDNPDTLCIFCMDTFDAEKPKLISGMAVLCKGAIGSSLGAFKDHRGPECDACVSEVRSKERILKSIEMVYDCFKEEDSILSNLFARFGGHLTGACVLLSVSPECWELDNREHSLMALIYVTMSRLMERIAEVGLEAVAERTIEEDGVPVTYVKATCFPVESTFARPHVRSIHTETGATQKVKSLVVADVPFRAAGDAYDVVNSASRVVCYNLVKS